MLTLHHKIPTFKYPRKEAYWNHFGKRRKCWLPGFSPFPTLFSILSNSKFLFWLAFILSPTNTFNFIRSNILCLASIALRNLTSLRLLYLLFFMYCCAFPMLVHVLRFFWRPFRLWFQYYKFGFIVIWVCWLVVSGFKATLTAKVISWRSVMHNMCFLAFSHQY